MRSCARSLRGRRRRLHFDAALVHHHVDVLIGHYADFEFRADGPHHGIPRVHQERPRAVVRDLEMRLALAQINLPSAPPQVGFDDGVGIQGDDRAVGQGDIALLADGRRQGLQFAALLQPDRADGDRGEHCGGREPPTPAMPQGRGLRRCSRTWRSSRRAWPRQALQRAPYRGQLRHRAPMTRILAQPGFERLPVGGVARRRVHAPYPRRRLLVDVGARAQFHDLTHSPSPTSRTPASRNGRGVSARSFGSIPSSIPASRK